MRVMFRTRWRSRSSDVLAATLLGLLALVFAGPVTAEDGESSEPAAAAAAAATDVVADGEAAGGGHGGGGAAPWRKRRGACTCAACIQETGRAGYSKTQGAPGIGSSRNLGETGAGAGQAASGSSTSPSSVAVCSLTILSANETARSVLIENEDSSFTQSFQASHEAVIIQHNISNQHWMMITVFDEDNTPIHRQFEILLSGLTITTSFGAGEHQIALMNNARATKFPNEPWQLTRLPNM